ncbi:histidine kinase [Sandaracinobacter sp. RS1-74]|uniref:sensor histidine kinase n=1 Tax=Sandaracinobacteroides sayramensis TaxID=2913411 RepID=UPI001EDA7C23|nr:histidine kinase [Sandaracinobacteroides sayramensis]MCG2841607.1 histidine kinase [Sandaracinobacteroides sayramensis]
MPAGVRKSDERVRASASGQQVLAPPSILPWVLPLLALIGVAFLVTAAVSLIGAWQLRAERLRQLDDTAFQLSQSLDREVEGQRALLVGLASSPALVRNDLRAFHAQLQGTAIPDDTWLILFDRTDLLLHSRFPFGTKLPPVADYKPAKGFFPELDAKRFIVTPRFYGVQLKISAVTVNIALQRAPGEAPLYLCTVIGDARFERIIRSHRFDPAMTIWIADWFRQGLIKVSPQEAVPAPPIPPGLFRQLKEGIFANSYASRTNVVIDGREVALAVHRSPFTHWTSVASLDRTELDAPLRDLMFRLGLAALLLAAAGWVAFRLFRREVLSIEDAVDEAHQEVLSLSQQLQGSQDEERRKIARELHDSTMQHLTGALLEAKALEGEGSRTAAALGDSIEKALNELRSYSLLLMPRELEGRTLSSALGQFAEAFSRRSGLSVEAEVDPVVDGLPQEARHALLRIGQEALANALRHGEATEVQLKAAPVAGQLLLAVTDNGRTARGRPSAWFEERAGVGLASMRSRLQPLGGRLHIEGLKTGVRLTVTLPLP